MDAPDFLYVRKVQTGTKLFEKLYGYCYSPGIHQVTEKSQTVYSLDAKIERLKKPVNRFFPSWTLFLLKALTLTLAVLLFYFPPSSAWKKEVLFTFFKMNLFFILSVLVPSHFEALLYIFSLTSHTSKFFQQSLRPCKVIQNPGSIIQLKKSGIPLMSGVRNPSSTAKELIESGIQYLESRIHGVESRMLGLALHDGRFYL